jgi:DNA-directed RNA polymerase subunit M/transcription elongation factor TFIIS
MSRYGFCPECGSDEVYYENPRTGYGGYVCLDCGYEFPREKEV